MFCDEAFGDKLITMPGVGVIGVILGDAKSKMELWDEKDPDFCYGNVPADYSPLQVKVAMQFYKDGYEFGEERGRDNAQHDMRKALGLFSMGGI